MKKTFYVLIGFTAMLLGLSGAILPVLPTIPFLLLAFYCFAHGSEKISKWFRGTRLYKKYLEEHLQRNALTRKQKISIQFFSGVMMLLSFILVDSWLAKGILLIAFVIHNYVFIFRIPTYQASNRCKLKLQRAKPTRLPVSRKWSLFLIPWR